MTPAAYERAAETRGDEGVGNALLARANLRWDMVYGNLDVLVPIVFPALTPVPALSSSLERMGADPERPPGDVRGEWADHLLWGVDSAVQAGRFLLQGDVVGAASIVRQQLERWTMNLAHTLNLEKEEGEDDQAFYSRVWARYAPNPIDAGHAYRDISELLHGRGPLTAALKWTQFDLMRRPLLAEAVEVIERIALTISLFLRQVRGCATGLAADKGRVSIVETLASWPERVPFEGTYEYLGLTLWPLTYPKLAHPGIDGLPAVKRRALQAGDEARAHGAAVDAFQLAVVHAYLDHRVRAIRGVHLSLEQERQALQDIDESSLDGQEVYTSFLAEMGTLISQWGVRPDVSVTLLTASNAVRSSFCLWLEDDDRAMISVRTLWESVARLRAWRLSPSARNA